MVYLILLYHFHQIPNITMKHLAQPDHYFHLYRLILSELRHRIICNLCSFGDILLFHLVLTNMLPKLILADLHAHLLSFSAYQ